MATPKGPGTPTLVMVVCYQLCDESFGGTWTRKSDRKRAGSLVRNGTAVFNFTRKKSFTARDSSPNTSKRSVRGLESWHRAGTILGFSGGGEGGAGQEKTKQVHRVTGARGGPAPLPGESGSAVACLGNSGKSILNTLKPPKDPYLRGFQSKFCFDFGMTRWTEKLSRQYSKFPGTQPPTASAGTVSPTDLGCCLDSTSVPLSVLVPSQGWVRVPLVATPPEAPLICQPFLISHGLDSSEQDWPRQAPRRVGRVSWLDWSYRWGRNHRCSVSIIPWSLGTTALQPG